MAGISVLFINLANTCGAPTLHPPATRGGVGASPGWLSADACFCACPEEGRSVGQPRRWGGLREELRSSSCTPHRAAFTQA